MSKVKTLGIGCAALLALNLLLVYFLFAHKPEGDRREPKLIIIEKLHLNAEQIKTYEQLIKWHQTNIQLQQNKIRPLKEHLYLQLVSKNPNTIQDSLMKEIAKVQLEIEHIHYKHFQDIKALCTPDQMHAYEALSHDLAKLFAPHAPHREKK